MSTQADNDSSYKLLFSHAELLQDLLLGFVHEEWVTQLDFTTLEKVSGSFTGDDLRNRENDIIWRVRYGDNWLYIYILLEFQTYVDDFMPVRVTDYVVSLYQDLRKAKQLPNKQLPPVLPVVIYTGKPGWNVPLDINAMITPIPELQRYQVHLRYLLLDVPAMADADLESMRNLAALLFRLEKSRSITTVRTLLRTLKEWLKTPAQASLRQAFTSWLRRVLLPKRLPKINIPELHDLHEVDTMLAENVREWVKPWVEQGRQEGRQDGIIIGRQEEAATILIKLMRRKFGQVPNAIIAQIKAAPLELIEQWSDNFVFANSIDEVLAS